jgi:uncharacterized membrane protein
MSISGRTRTPRSSSYLETWAKDAPLGGARTLMLWALAAAYVGFGLFHLLEPDSFLPIMPPAIPFPREVVLFTGASELAGGLGLLVPRTRRAAAIMLALYALCVWPANIYHAVAGVHVGGLPDSGWYHGPRLALQPVIAWWPLFAAGVVNWPFGKRGG